MTDEPIPPETEAEITRKVIEHARAIAELTELVNMGRDDMAPFIAHHAQQIVDAWAPLRLAAGVNRHPTPDTAPKEAKGKYYEPARYILGRKFEHELGEFDRYIKSRSSNSEPFAPLPAPTLETLYDDWRKQAASPEELAILDSTDPDAIWRGIRR